SYAFYIDDAAPQNLEAFEAFEFRLLHNLPQLDPALDAFAAVLKRMWDFYDALSARAIFTACLEFVDMTCIEPSMSQVEMHRTSQRLPWYIRQRSSGSTPFAVFTFPRRLGIPFMAYFPVLPDMDYFLSGINDLFSFYKEELKGEEGNFVHMRARAEGKPPMQVAAELSEELLVARSTIHAALRPHPEAFKAWIDREKGYIAWHMFLPRYKLQEI
ncbi:terpenoid synthase, partial [Fistulina hepatica ATCC 64428]